MRLNCLELHLMIGDIIVILIIDFITNRILIVVVLLVNFIKQLLFLLWLLLV